MIYATIEVHKYRLMKDTHSWDTETYETHKEYQLKFSGELQECKDMMNEFKSFAKAHECLWSWDHEEDKMKEESYLSEYFRCYCQLMSSFLAANNFIPAFASPILHYYYKN